LQDQIKRKNGVLSFGKEEEELSNKISLLSIEKMELEKQIEEVNQVLVDQDRFFNYIDSMKLEIMVNDQKYSVTSKNIIGAKNNSDYLRMRLSVLKIRLEQKENEIDQLDEARKKALISNGEGLFQMEESVDEMAVRASLLKTNINQEDAFRLLSIAQKKRLEATHKIEKTIKDADRYIVKIYQELGKIVSVLNIEDKIGPKADYIFTDEVKQFSGAILQKMVFAFKLAFHKIVEGKLGEPLPFVIDSPRGKELDEDNTRLLFKALKMELPNSQVLVASIYDQYPFDQQIEFKNYAIEDRTTSSVLTKNN
jgi:hypothetical protein